ncbi:FAD-dependent oxidoreductase [Acuticoccus mangrovi]|uniref:FAD-binding protein n=1 Tax=Acuticoccus mangrovi TaxID=2796142 RepID=A0A934MGV0_9HYPH|nr:FAD-dependent oxidoreductase [Acuticoccus mangrovi]MBJ3776983.1 FAD-binding protein [Acuticoccus mangrovi]
MPHLDADVLVIGAGAAGMYAAIAAANAGADVLLVDKSIVGRGGATIMAQMTVAAALNQDGDDGWLKHHRDTLKAGRGLCNEELSEILCKEAPDRIRELDAWKVGWARREDGKINGVMAPGHSVPRCVYVDFLNTGPAVARTMRVKVSRTKGVRRVSGLSVREIVVHEGRAIGAVAVNVDDGQVVTIAAKAVVMAAGGLTKLFRRNSASANMGGDAYAIALRAGASLLDMEFPQFFPIGHLAPRLVGMDPIMWDPFRYKLGGRLLNGNMDEFLENYGFSDGGKYTATRDETAYAIVRENEAGRGSPAGGAYLSFTHVPEAELRRAFGPVIDLLAENGIDLTQNAVEVAPIAHYHMGGIRVDGEMATDVPGLYAAGEAVGGANGANRLSGNAIPEAFVFGERAGRFAAAMAAGRALVWEEAAAAPALALIGEIDARAEAGGTGPTATIGELWFEVQEMMWEKVGLMRDEASLTAALERLREIRTNDLATVPLSPGHAHNTTVEDWFDLRNAVEVAECIALAALNRRESRGAHQRLDYTATDPEFDRNQVLRLSGTEIVADWVPVVHTDTSLEEVA